ncbi:MAG: biotin transporter BioY [Calditrichaeota bacterium]|nr:biotin transporter BioY [Calditrichota bacterium]
MKSHRSLILTGLFAALTAVGAYLKIPLPGVPITLQTFFVYLSANVLGAYYGALSQILYLLIGLIGIPVFAFGGGPGYLFQPTFGYLLSYPISVFFIGKALNAFRVNRSGSPKKLSHLFLRFVAADLVGVVVIFFFGLGYMYCNLHWGLYLKFNESAASNLLSWKNLLRTTMLIFVPIDLIKVFLASLVSTRLFQKYSFVKLPVIKKAEVS